MRVHFSILDKTTVFAVEGFTVVTSWDIKTCLRMVPTDEGIRMIAIADTFAKLVVVDHVEVVHLALKIAGCSRHTFNTD